MKISELALALSADILACPGLAQREVSTAYAGDMLSDVLALGKQPDVLLTGLLNPQVIRTAEMLDTACVIFVRGKAVSESILSLAEKCGICVLSTRLEMYPACTALFGAGISAPL